MISFSSNLFPAPSHHRLLSLKPYNYIPATYIFWVSSSFVFLLSLRVYSGAYKTVLLLINMPYTFTYQRQGHCLPCMCETRCLTWFPVSIPTRLSDKVCSIMWRKIHSDMNIYCTSVPTLLPGTVYTCTFWVGIFTVPGTDGPSL